MLRLMHSLLLLQRRKFSHRTAMGQIGIIPVTSAISFERKKLESLFLND